MALVAALAVHAFLILSISFDVSREKPPAPERTLDITLVQPKVEPKLTENPDFLALLCQEIRVLGEFGLIGAGGIASAADAYAKIRAGASLVQLYTGLVYEGPGLVKTLKEGLVELLTADGFSSVSKAVGVDA